LPNNRRDPTDPYPRRPNLNGIRFPCYRAWLGRPYCVTNTVAARRVACPSCKWSYAATLVQRRRPHADT